MSPSFGLPPPRAFSPCFPLLFSLSHNNLLLRAPFSCSDRQELKWG